MRRYSKPGVNTLGTIVLWILVCCIFVVCVRGAGFFSQLTTGIAMSNATDAVNKAVSDAVRQVITAEGYNYDSFVTLEKREDGSVSAIISNMAEINSFSSKVLELVTDKAKNDEMNLSVPLGTVLGLSFTMGKGPGIPTEIDMMTSSHTEFRNEMTSAGINQTRHQIILDVIVDVDIVVPWKTVSSTVTSSAIVAETVIVGTVPQTYIETE